MKEFHWLDKIKLLAIVLYVSIALALGDVNISKALQDWLIMLTHLSSVPLVVVLWKTQWVAITLAIGVVFSVACHIAIIFDVFLWRIEPLDIAFANLTLMLVVCILVFKKIPLIALPILFTITVVNTVFWDQMIVYGVFSGIANVGAIGYVLYRQCYPSDNRDDRFMLIGILTGIVGMVFFLMDGKHDDKNYALLHSVWHVCSYGSLYFAVRSDTGTELRRPRIEFAVEYNKIEFALH